MRAIAVIPVILLAAFLLPDLVRMYRIERRWSDAMRAAYRARYPSASRRSDQWN